MSDEPIQGITPAMKFFYVYLHILADLACLGCFAMIFYIEINHQKSNILVWLLWSLFFWQITRLIRKYVPQYKWTVGVPMPYWFCLLLSRVFRCCCLIVLMIMAYGVIVKVLDREPQILYCIIGAVASLIAYLFKRFNYICFYPKPEDENNDFGLDNNDEIPKE